MLIRKILTRNKYIYYLITRILIVQYLVRFNINKIFRVWRFNKTSRYEKLKNLKDKHKGERVFIVATGPSLTVDDLEKLKNEITFSMNSICLAFDASDWRPTYYAIQDGGVYKKFEKQIENLECEGKFVSDGVSKHIPDDYYVYPLNLLNHGFFHRRYNTKFSDDAFKVVYDGYNIAFSIVQLAVYMGFKEIYLLGADCDYSSKTTQHFKEYGIVKSSLTFGEKFIFSYREAKKYADKNNIKIYNATRGGKLEVFERVNLDDVLTASNKETERLNVTVSVG